MSVGTVLIGGFLVLGGAVLGGWGVARYIAKGMRDSM